MLTVQITTLPDLPTMSNQTISLYHIPSFDHMVAKRLGKLDSELSYALKFAAQHVHTNLPKGSIRERNVHVPLPRGDLSTPVLRRIHQTEERME